MFITGTFQSVMIMMQYGYTLRCFNDVKTAVRISTATGRSTALDLEILLENSGLVRPIIFINV